jgi:hypothetical protein
MNSSMHGAEVFALRAFVVDFGSDSRSELDSVGMATESDATIEYQQRHTRDFLGILTTSLSST